MHFDCRAAPKKGTALTADYTALVRTHQSTSVPVRPGSKSDLGGFYLDRSLTLCELYRKLFLAPTAKRVGKVEGYQVE